MFQGGSESRTLSLCGCLLTVWTITQKSRITLFLETPCTNLDEENLMCSTTRSPIEQTEKLHIYATQYINFKKLYSYYNLCFSKLIQS